MRCIGRLANAQLPTSIKQPILLDNSHHLTSLIVRDSHKRVMHSGVKATLTELRGSVSYKTGSSWESYCNQCVVCRKLEGRPYRAPPAPPLPKFRVKDKPPFTCVGIDFAGYVATWRILVATVLNRKCGSAHMLCHKSCPFGSCTRSGG